MRGRIGLGYGNERLGSSVFKILKKLEAGKMLRHIVGVFLYYFYYFLGAIKYLL